MMPAKGYHGRAGRRRRAGFTLIEMVGVLAVLTVIALLAARQSLAWLQDEARRTEAATLREMGEALKAGIVRQRGIPAENELVELVAQELARPVGQVERNRLGRMRGFLVDPAFRVGEVDEEAGEEGEELDVRGLPYVQTVAGSPPPVSPRVLLISSLGEPLPVEIDFEEVWDLAVGSVPAGWGQDPEDLLVYRLDLRGLFHRVLLENVDDDRVARFTMDGGAVETIPARTRRQAWYLGQTAITFFYATGEIQAREHLREDVSYVHEFGRWGRTFQHGTRPSGGWFGELIERFLAANPPASPKFGASQPSVVEELYQYLLHTAWWAMGDAAKGIPPFDDGGSTSQPQVPQHRMTVDAQVRLEETTDNLIN